VLQSIDPPETLNAVRSLYVGTNILYTSTSGETPSLVIPEEIKRRQDYQEGRVQHVALAVRAAMSGAEPAAKTELEPVIAREKHMVKYQILYWKHVPSQVKVFEEGKRPVSRPMPERFQAEINRIAMAEGLAGTDDYLNQWQWTPKMEREGSAEGVADALVRELQQNAGDKDGSKT